MHVHRISDTSVPTAFSATDSGKISEIHEKIVGKKEEPTPRETARLGTEGPELDRQQPDPEHNEPYGSEYESNLHAYKAGVDAHNEGYDRSAPGSMKDREKFWINGYDHAAEYSTATGDREKSPDTETPADPDQQEVVGDVQHRHETGTAPMNEQMDHLVPQDREKLSDRHREQVERQEQRAEENDIANQHLTARPDQGRQASLTGDEGIVSEYDREQDEARQREREAAEKGEHKDRNGSD